MGSARFARRYPDFDRGMMACEGWVILPINMVVGLRRQKTDPRSDGALPFVGMDDIEPHGLKVLRTRPFAEMRSLGNRFRSGDLLYGRLRPYLNKTAVAVGDGACSGELRVLEPTPALDARYLQYYLHSQRFVGWVSATTSGDRPRVGFETLAGFAIPLVPLPEQRRIVARIDALFTEIAEGEAALAEARKGLPEPRSQKSSAASPMLSRPPPRRKPGSMPRPADAARLEQSILESAFEGRLVPQDPADEPASALLARVHAAQERRVGVGRQRARRAGKAGLIPTQ
jgi:hypothetical protein